MSTRSDLSRIVLGAAAAAAAGLTTGAWLALPAALEEPASDGRDVATVDPNLSAYRAMLVAEGVSPEPYVIADYAPRPWTPSARPESEEDETDTWRTTDYPTDDPYETAYAAAGQPSPAEEPASAPAEIAAWRPDPAPEQVAAADDPASEESGDPRGLAYGPPSPWLAPHGPAEAWPSWR